MEQIQTIKKIYSTSRTFCSSFINQSLLESINEKFVPVLNAALIENRGETIKKIYN